MTDFFGFYKKIFNKKPAFFRIKINFYFATQKLGYNLFSYGNLRGAFSDPLNPSHLDLDAKRYSGTLLIIKNSNPTYLLSKIEVVSHYFNTKTLDLFSIFFVLHKFSD